MANDEKKEETRGTTEGSLNGRMTLLVRQTQAVAQAAGVKSPGVEESQYHGSTVVWVISASPSYCDNERKVAVRRIVFAS